MNQEVNDKPGVDLAQIRSDIAAINDLPTLSHSAAFEIIHKQLQQALANLDGV
jgi:hypothetical protein